MDRRREAGGAALRKYHGGDAQAGRRPDYGAQVHGIRYAVQAGPHRSLQILLEPHRLVHVQLPHLLGLYDHALMIPPRGQLLQRALVAEVHPHVALAGQHGKIGHALVLFAARDQQPQNLAPAGLQDFFRGVYSEQNFSSHISLKPKNKRERAAGGRHFPLRPITSPRAGSSRNSSPRPARSALPAPRAIRGAVCPPPPLCRPR